MPQLIAGNVAITEYTPIHDDLIADDAAFMISPGATLVLLGDDVFENTTVGNAGVWRIRGPLEVNQVALLGHAFAANNATVTQTGDVAMGQASANDLTVIRNLPHAVWDITADVDIGPSANFSRFVNLGLFEKTGGTGTSVVASIFNSVGDVEVDSGELQFTGLRARFTGSVGGAGTIDVTTRALLDGVTVSAASFNADLAIIHDDVVISGAFDIDTVVLQNGRLELTGDDSFLPTVIKGSGAVVVEGDVKLTTLTLYQHVELDNQGRITVVPDASGKDGFDIVAPASGSISTINNLAGATFAWDLPALTDDNLQRIDDGLSSAFSGWTGSGEVSASIFNNEGTVEQSVGWSHSNIRFDNEGVVHIGGAADDVFASVKVFEQDVSGGGTVNIDGGGVVVFEAGVSASQTVDFVGAQLTPLDPLALGIVDLADFHALIAGFGTGSAPETISVADWTFDGFSFDGGGAADGLLFERNGDEASLTLSDSIDVSNIDVHAGSGGLGAVITYSDAA